MSRYENDFYFDERYAKGSAVSIASSELTKNILKYCAMDAISVFGIHDMQLRLAALDGGAKDFSRRVLGVWSDTTHVISQFVKVGTHVDREYVVRQYGEDTSDIDKERERLLEELYNTKAVKKTNKLLLKNGPSYTSLFADTEFDEEWVFDITKEEHKKLLFFDVLGLEPLETTPTGQPSLGKAFKQYYSEEATDYYSPEVALWSAIEETVIVKSNVRAYYHKIHDEDGIHDDCVHAQYGYMMVVTGRSNSYNPNLQNAPNHGQYAKMVKRAFCARPEHVQIKTDYSTHEIACWCQQSGDKALAKVFKDIRKAGEKFLRKPTEKNAAKLLLMDLHRINYSLFTGTPVNEVTKSQRQYSKNLTFGAIYGESMRTVSEKLGIPLDEMKEIHERFFGKFPDARDWLEWARNFAAEHFYVYNPLGHRRHLYGYMTGMQGVKGAMDRRAANSPIQGFASQLLFMAARIFHLGIIKKLNEMGEIPEPTWDKKLARFVIPPLPIQICQSIHDSLHTDVRYDNLPLAMEALKYFTSEGLMWYTNKMYGVDWIVHPRVDFEIGDTGDALMKWDGTSQSLNEILAKTTESHKARGYSVPEYAIAA